MSSAPPLELPLAHRAALLGARPLADLPPEEFSALLLFLRRRSLGRADVLFREGAPGDSLVFVVAGQLTVTVRRLAGGNVEVGEIGPGEVVGEMAIIDPAPRNATVTAREAATVYEIDRSNFDAMRRQFPGLSSAIVGAIIRDVTRRLREVDARIARELSPGEAAAAAPAGAGTRPGDGRDSSPTAPIDRGPERKRSLWNFLANLRGSG